MGATPHTLGKLDLVQKRAADIIGNSTLDTLSHRRTVAALTYLFKLLCMDGPERLKNMIPPFAPRPPAGTTRLQKNDAASWHQLKLVNPLPTRSLDNARRSFPYGVIETWNALPKCIFPEEVDIKHLQTFKKSTNDYLRNPDKPTTKREASRPCW